MLIRVVGRPLGLLLLGAGLLLVWASSGQGQQQLSDQTLSTNFNTPSNYKARQELIAGQRPPDKEDQKLMDLTAKYYVHRVTWPSPRTNSSEMAKLHEDLESQLINLLLNTNAAQKNGAFKDQLGKHLAKSLEEVLTLDFADNRVAVLNAALMLPAIAKLKQEAVGDLLVKLLKDNSRHDAVKVYAAKAMREFFPAHMAAFTDDPTDAKLQSALKRDTQRLEALVEFMERKGPKGADEDRDVIHYLRREAVISLAHIGVPALSALKKDKAVVGPAAYELLRVLVKSKGAYQPLPSLSERVEAALGLCRLKDTAGDGKYDPSMAVYAIGLCFFDYATEYKTDYVNIVGRKEAKNPKEDSKIPTMAWRIQSERFKQGMKELVANTKGTPARANAEKLEGEISRIADSIRNYGPLGELGAFRSLVDSMAPKSGQLYKLKGPQIDPETLQGGPADGK